MKKEYVRVLFVLILIIVMVIMKNYISNTFAYSYDLENTTLFYDDNKEILEEKIKTYLSDIDDMLIVNSSFEYNDILKYNYDFLVYFAMDYILRYKEYYQDEIIILEDYEYINKFGASNKTNLYISKENIYDITDKYFGIRDFKILNDNINIIDDNISLIDYDDSYFPLDIERVFIVDNNPIIEAFVYYEDNTNYNYIFRVVNNVLKLENIEVLL